MSNKPWTVPDDALCPVCGITAAEAETPTKKYRSRHSSTEPACMWAKAASRLWHHVHRGGDIDDLACLFCAIPRSAHKGTKWAAVHEREGVPVCQAAYDAKRRAHSYGMKHYPDSHGNDFFYDKNGTTHSHGTMTREQYMAERGR